MRSNAGNRTERKQSLDFGSLMTALTVMVAMIVAFPMVGQTATMVCTPDTSHVGPSEQFVVDITVDATTEALHCYNITIDFDTSIVTLIDVAEGSLIDDSGQPSFFFWDSTGGVLNIGDCLLGYGLHVNGPGSVAQLTLEAKPQSGITLVSIDVVDFSDTALVMIPVDADPGTIIVGTPSCCGVYSGGFTGNANCSPDGKRNLADITRLIDRVYIGKSVLCCELNGNVDGDALDKINLADITRLVDHVYISKNETAPCQ